MVLSWSQLEDIGGSIDGLRAVRLDDVDLDVLGGSEPTSAPVHSLICRWRLSKYHFGSTANGLRDYVPLELHYSYAGAPRVLAFYLQAKMYSAKDARRRQRASEVGLILDGATCTYDGGKDPQREERPEPQGLLPSSTPPGRLEWTFEQASDSTAARATDDAARPHGVWSALVGRTRPSGPPPSAAPVLVRPMRPPPVGEQGRQTDGS
jgi:hypothetical protein